jgi:hypothetical protein
LNGKKFLENRLIKLTVGLSATVNISSSGSQEKKMARQRNSWENFLN